MALILNKDFKLMEVGPDHVLIAPDGNEFHAVNAEMFEFIQLFSSGAEADYVVEQLQQKFGSQGMNKHEITEIIDQLESSSILLYAEAFVRPTFERVVDFRRPVTLRYDIDWMREHHPEMIDSPTSFGDTWSPAAIG